MATESRTYLATALPGLEDVAAAELRAKLGDGILDCETGRGRVLVRSRLAPQDFLQLRSIDNLYVVIAALTVGPHRIHLPDCETAIARVDLSAAAAVAGLDRDSALSIYVNASRVGKHTYSRFELAAAATKGILAGRRRWTEGTPEAHEAEFRLDLTDDEALFSLRLTPPTFRFRGDARRFSEAALRPTVAHALVWLSAPRPDEHFLDPFCGSGTIVAERAAYPAASVVGSDIVEATVRTAQANVPTGVVVNCWDARNLPLDAGSVDTVVANLPFGRQILAPEDIGPLYLAFCRELGRVLAKTGQGLLLTDQTDQVTQGAERAGLSLVDLRQLSLKGLHPHLYRVSRR